ncbi:tail tube protein [Paucimonas lemoignei]|uniref:Tail tube protein n=1 Tax=Paucimonas lemoignei TaxID=29443 RepID=A0A4R3HRP7_PAULE|nr:phage tail tube protein [Paucimonas lemoignei]TCS35797.1 tail tube protein [Paucimonas lemoignei]
MSTLLARLKLTFSGKTLATEERSTEIDIGGEDNEPVVDSTGNTHSLGNLQPGMIRCNLLATEGFKLREVQEIRNGTIIAEGNNGSSYIMRKATCGTARVISGGKIAATFFGDVEEM